MILEVFGLFPLLKTSYAFGMSNIKSKPYPDKEYMKKCDVFGRWVFLPPTFKGMQSGEAKIMI